MPPAARQVVGDTAVKVILQVPGPGAVQGVCETVPLLQDVPNAKIVADRFHVIRLTNQLSMQTFHQIDPAMKYQRGILMALKTKPENLTPLRLSKRDRYLEQQPAIAAIYDFKQQLHQLLTKKHCTAKECKRLLPHFLEMVKELKQSAFQHLRSMRSANYGLRDLADV